MMIIIIELFSFLFWTRTVYGGTSSEPCAVSTTNEYTYMCPDLEISGLTEFDIDATNLGCGQAKLESKQRHLQSSATITTQISCNDVGEDYVIDCMVYASLGMVAGNCGQLNSGFTDPNANDHPTHDWCINDGYTYTCCFGDDDIYIPVNEIIGEECIGESECEITVSKNGLSVTIEDELVEKPFTTDELATLEKIAGPWALKVLFQCAPVTEYEQYEFVVDDSDFSDYTDINVVIIGYCVDGTGPTLNPPDELNECVYSGFRFKVYVEGNRNRLGDTRIWFVRNVPKCNTEYSGSLPVDVDHNIHFTVTKTGGDC